MKKIILAIIALSAFITSAQTPFPKGAFFPNVTEKMDADSLAVFNNGILNGYISKAALLTPLARTTITDSITSGSIRPIQIYNKVMDNGTTRLFTIDYRGIQAGSVFSGTTEDIPNKLWFGYSIGRVANDTLSGFLRFQHSGNPPSNGLQNLLISTYNKGFTLSHNNGGVSTGTPTNAYAVFEQTGLFKAPLSTVDSLDKASGTYIPNKDYVNYFNNLSKPTKRGYKFTVLPNIDADNDTIGNTGMTYNTQTDEYVISYYSFAKESKLWFYHRNSQNLLNYKETGTLIPAPDREIDVSAYLYHIQGVAYDDSNNSYWILGSINTISDDAERRLININDSGGLLSSTDLASMSFQPGMIFCNNRNNELIIKPNDNTDLYFLDKTTKTVIRTETTFTIHEGLAFDSNRDLIWVAGRTAGGENKIVVYAYDTMEELAEFPLKTLPLSSTENVEGMLIDPIDDKLLISFDGFLHGSNNNGNALFKYDFPRYTSKENKQKLKTYTVATLPASPEIGDQYLITDADAPSWNTAVVGGGAIKVVVYYDGTNWISH